MLEMLTNAERVDEMHDLRHHLGHHSTDCVFPGRQHGASSLCATWSEQALVTLLVAFAKGSCDAQLKKGASSEQAN